MSKRLGVMVLGILLSSFPAWAECTLPLVCADVAESLTVSRSGGFVTNVWSSDQEPADLSHYRVVRSQNPENGTWTAVETVEPDRVCEGTATPYEVQEQDPGSGWTYGVQVYGNSGLVCTIVEH